MDTPGVFERANHATLLIDEIGELSLELQPKILRILDRRQVQRVRDTVTRPVDVRVISATHRHVAALAGEDRFRARPLLSASAAHAQRSPAAREPEGLALLAQRFLTTSKRAHEARVEIRDDRSGCSKKLHWEGNVRQLKQISERLAFLVGDHVITVETLWRLGDDDRFRDLRGA